MKNILFFVLCLALTTNCKADVNTFKTAIYMNDSLDVDSYTSVYMEATNAFARGSNVDKTSDNLYFVLAPSWYVLYVPEIHTRFTVMSMNGDKSVGAHLAYLIEQIRKYRNQLSSFYP